MPHLILMLTAVGRDGHGTTELTGALQVLLAATAAAFVLLGVFRVQIYIRLAKGLFAFLPCIWLDHAPLRRLIELTLNQLQVMVLRYLLGRGHVRKQLILGVWSDGRWA